MADRIRTVVSFQPIEEFTSGEDSSVHYHTSPVTGKILGGSGQHDLSGSIDSSLGYNLLCNSIPIIETPIIIIARIIVLIYTKLRFNLIGNLALEDFSMFFVIKFSIFLLFF